MGGVSSRVSIVVVLCLTFAAGHSLAFPVSSVRFVGLHRVDPAALLRAIRTSNDPLARNFTVQSELLLSVQEVQKVVSRALVQEGLYHASVDSFQLSLRIPADTTKGYDITLFITEGRRYRIGAITIAGATVLAEDEIRQRITVASGQVLNERVLETDLQSILELYQQSGFPLAKVEILSIISKDLPEPGEGVIDITLGVTEGRRARIERIAVTGNSATSSDVILRELRVPLGGYYDSRELERARARVERLGFFDFVSEPELFVLSDTSLAVLMHVKEGNTSTIDAVLGYVPGRTPAENGYVNGLANLDFRNISGTGRNGMLSYQRLDKFSQQLEVRYLEPWLFGYPLNFAGGFEEHVQDSSFTRTALNAALTLLFTEDINLSATGSLERIIPTDVPDQAFTAYDSRTLGYGLVANIDTRDNVLAPRSGVMGSLGASYGVKEIYGPARFIDSSTPHSIGLRTLSIDIAGYVPTFNARTIAAVGVHAKSVTAFGGELDQSDLTRLGGLRSIRGYREAELLASRYIYGNFEARFLTGRTTFIFGFVDAGYLVTDPTLFAPQEQVQKPLSYGVGAQVESPLGIISVTGALAKGEPLDQIKIHFGLISQF